MKDIEHSSKEQLDIFKIFISLAVKIYRMKLGEISIPHDELINEIKTSRTISRAWLVEKVKEL